MVVLATASIRDSTPAMAYISSTSTSPRSWGVRGLVPVLVTPSTPQPIHVVTRCGQGAGVVHRAAARGAQTESETSSGAHLLDIANYRNIGIILSCLFLSTTSAFPNNVQVEQEQKMAAMEADEHLTGIGDIADEQAGNKPMSWRDVWPGEHRARRQYRDAPAAV
jgi:hypothetical protein